MVAMALWHLELTPGQTENILVRRDFQITNVALGEEIADVNSRSVIKVTHSPINPMLLESDDEDDSEFDDDEDEDEDDDEEEVDEEVEEPKTKKGGKVSVLEGKTAEEIEEEDEEMDDISEGESDFTFDEPEATAVIAALTPGKIEQASTNLIFVQGEAISFEVTGNNVVHLMGNYILQETGSHDHDHGHDDYDDLESDDEDYEDEELDSDDEMGSITSSQLEDMEKMFGQGKGKKSPVELLEDEPKKTPASNKRKAETQEVDSPVSAAKAAISSAAASAANAVSSAASALTGAAGEAAKEGEQLNKAQKKKLAKKMKLESGEAAEGVKKTVEATKEKAKEVVEKVAPAPKKEEKKSTKQTLPSGLIIEDTKVGDGVVAKQGKRLGMRYIGKLTSGKQFDANTSGAPFKFVLGRGEVIKGWDQGIAGMKVGGERRLTIPAALAYGKQKIPGIPPNSTLIFEIKLVDVK